MQAKFHALKLGTVTRPVYFYRLFTLPYRVACLLTLPVTDLHLFLFCAILLHCSMFMPAHCRMLSLHCSHGHPLPRLPYTMSF